LLELWAVTRDDAFRYGAEQAFAYEAHHFDVEAANWPDFRCYEWDELLRSPERAAATRAALQAGANLPGYVPRHMVAWCHGAAGIGLSRLRALRLLGDSRYAVEARTAVAQTFAALRAPATNFSLCHGLFGNFEMLLWAAEQFGEQSWRAEVERRTDAAIAVFEGAVPRPWPSGVAGNEPDPSLLVGEAGIGHYLLRLARPEVPSVLCPLAPVADENPASSRTSDAHGAENGSLHAQRRLDEQAYFARTLRIFERLGVERDVRKHVTRLSRTQPRQPTVAVLAAAIDARIAEESSPARAAVLADAAAVDRARYDATRRLPDFVSELIDECRRLPADRIDWLQARFRLAPCVSVISSGRDWDGWLTATAGDARLPKDSTTVYVLFRYNRAVHVARPGALAAAVIGILSDCADHPEGEGLTVDEIVARICEPADIGPTERSMLAVRVHAQVRQSYADRLLVTAGGLGTDCRPGSGAPARTGS
jgi:hypothetical protein